MVELVIVPAELVNVILVSAEMLAKEVSEMNHTLARGSNLDNVVIF